MSKSAIQKALDAQEREQARALREAHCNQSEEAYFKARPQMDNHNHRKLFQAGFERGFNSELRYKYINDGASTPHQRAMGAENVEREPIDSLENIASYLGLGGFNGATPERLEARIKAEFDRISTLLKVSQNIKQVYKCRQAKNEDV